MRPTYLDTSALIKHYVAEPGSVWVDALIAQPDALVLTSRLTMVEVMSALARRKREASVSSRHHSEALSAFREDCVSRYRFVEFGLPVIEIAGNLLARYPLRAYDAVQLASAVAAERVLTAAGFTLPLFLSADDRLLPIAQSEGLVTDNPNLHV